MRTTSFVLQNFFEQKNKIFNILSSAVVCLAPRLCPSQNPFISPFDSLKKIHKQAR